MLRRWTMLVTVVAVALAASLSVAYACGWYGRTNGVSGRSTNHRGTGVSGLTAEQSKRAEAVRQRYTTQLQALEEETAAKQAQLRDYALREDADPAQVKAYRREIRDLMGRMEDLRFDEQQAVRKAVPELQRTRYYWDDNWCYNNCGRDRQWQSSHGGEPRSRGSSAPAWRGYGGNGCCW